MKNAITLIADDATAGVHISVKILQPPRARVHFHHFINGDCCLTIPYILISFVRENRLKPALHVGVDRAKQGEMAA